MSFVSMKVSDLDGAALNWAVATALGFQNVESQWGDVVSQDPNDSVAYDVHEYTDNWETAGQLIEFHGISVIQDEAGAWSAECRARPEVQPIAGPSPIIAALRVYVHMTMGEQVAVPRAILDGAATPDADVWFEGVDDAAGVVCLRVL
jgi:hypothetical protein